MNVKKSTIIFIPIVLIGFISTYIYFVTGVSSTYPPIKEYSYSGTSYQLISSLQKYAVTNANLIFMVTDTTGDLNSDYAIYMTIEMRNIEYSLRCEEDKSKSKPNTKVKLVGAYDKSLNVGGYSKEAKGIDALVNRFDIDVLAPLKANANIEIFQP